MVLRLVGDIPMVADDRWDELTVSRYPTLESAESAAGRADEAFGGHAPRAIVLVTQPLSASGA